MKQQLITLHSSFSNMLQVHSNTHRTYKFGAPVEILEIYLK